MLMHVRSRGRQPLRRSAQQGVVAVVVAMTMVAMVGMVGLAVDLGQMFIAKTEAQNSADACALAAVGDMDGSSNYLERSEASGRTVARQHRVGFQSNAVGGTTTPVTVTFATSAAGTFDPLSIIGSKNNPPTMTHVKCEVTYTGIKTFFIQALNALPGVNIGDQSVLASAVAGKVPSQGGCAIPIAICVADAIPARIGSWLPGPLQSGNDAVAGEFGWVDLTPGGNGTADIGRQLTGNGVCTLPSIGTAIRASGNRVALASYFNSRFGIYFGSVTADEAKPDTTGYAYTYKTWDANAGNAYADLVNKRAVYAAYQNDEVLTGLDVKGTVQPSSYLQANGRNRRVVTVPIVQCGADGRIPSNPVLADWGCVFLIQPVAANDPNGKDCFGNPSGTGTKVCVEYRGKANAANSPCLSSGLPGSPTSPGPNVPALVK